MVAEKIRILSKLITPPDPVMKGQIARPSERSDMPRGTI
jgi:hypothetical protein